MNLSEKMERWGKLRAELDALEVEIQSEVLPLGKTQDVGRVTAAYSGGRGSYDYQAMGLALQPGADLVHRYSKMVTDWRKVCDAVGVDDDVRRRYYKAGTPSVSLKLKPAD